MELPTMNYFSFPSSPMVTHTSSQQTTLLINPDMDMYSHQDDGNESVFLFSLK